MQPGSTATRARVLRAAGLRDEVGPGGFFSCPSVYRPSAPGFVHVPLQKALQRNAMLTPRVILLADGFTDRTRYEQAVSAIDAGIQWVHLRDHEASTDAFQSAARSFVDDIRQQYPRVRVSVNSRLNTAASLGVGYHGGFRGASPVEARQRLGVEATIGYSAHEIRDVTGPLSEVIDYFLYSPVFPTSSKPGHPGVGLDTLADVSERSSVPVYALGGVTPERAGACIEAGAHGVAVLSGIMEAEKVAQAVDAYLNGVNV